MKDSFHRNEKTVFFDIVILPLRLFLIWGKNDMVVSQKKDFSEEN